MSLSVLTASGLRDGEPVFWDAGRWLKRFADAELFDAPASGEAALAAARARATEVVEPYLIEVTLDGGAPVPTALRERVRALGPTVHPEMGRQAEGGAAVEAIRRHAGGARSAGRLGLIRLKK